MAVVNLGDIVCVKFACNMGDQVGLNIRHYECTLSTALGVSVLEVATYFDGLFAPLYKPMLGNNASYYGANAQVVGPGAKQLSVTSAANIGIGTAATGCLPGQVSGMITMTTLFAGRKNRGRIYVPFPAIGFDSTTLNVPVAGYKVLLDAIGGIFTATPLIPGTGGTCRLKPIIYRGPAQPRTDIVGFQSRLRWATQRSRGNYGRPNAYPPF